MGEDLLRDDQRVRDAFRGGERWALAEVYRVYYPVVNLVMTRGFGGFRGFFNPADRDDAVQTVFTVAFEEKARQRYDGLKPYQSYLRGIAQNVVRRMLEKRTRFQRKDGQPELQNRRVETAEESLLGAEATRVAAAFRDSLTDTCERGVLDAYYVDGQAEETIASEMGLTRYRVRKLIQGIHRKMTRYMAAHGLP